ncbi:MAG: hypothetical protein ACRD2W_02725 [Acidimicrobiales bacterium]
MSAIVVLCADAFPPDLPEAPSPAAPTFPSVPLFPPVPTDPPPMHPPAPPTCREDLADLATGTAPLSNCSASPTSRIVELVRRTDAAYEGLIRPGDRLLANNQWVAWIDTQDAPGIVRGLWGIDADGNFVGITEPEIAPDAAKSVLAIARGFTSIDAPYGYKGLHVEIWKTLERASPFADECAPANCLYTVPNDVRFAETPETVRITPTAVSASYSTPLVNVSPPTPGCPSCGTTTFVGLNGVATELVWYVNYTMTRDSFTIVTALGANADVDFSGAAGGLLLLLNPGCRAMARDAYPGDRHFRNCDPAQVTERSLHHVEGPAIGTGRATPSSERIVVNGHTADAFAPEFQTIDPHEDRFVNQHNDTSPFTLRYHDGRVAMTVTPGWGVGDPHASNWMTGFALHFNSSPATLGYDDRRGLSGVLGIASLDAYTQPTCPDTCRLAVGPTRGLLFWQMALTR